MLDLLPIIYFKGGCIVPISIRLGKSRLVRSSLLTRHAIFSCLFRNPVFCSSQIETYSAFEVVLSIISPTSILWHTNQQDQVQITERFQCQYYSKNAVLQSFSVNVDIYCLPPVLHLCQMQRQCIFRFPYGESFCCTLS